MSSTYCWYLLPDDLFTDALADAFVRVDEYEWVGVPTLSDPIWEALIEASILPVTFYNLGGRAGAGSRLVAWNTAGVAGVGLTPHTRRATLLAARLRA
jgi:hypothetical protein